MTTVEIMSEIYKSGNQLEVFNLLHKWVLNSLNKLESENANLTACKVAVRNINAARFRDEAIDALCE